MGFPSRKLERYFNVEIFVFISIRKCSGIPSKSLCPLADSWDHIKVIFSDGFLLDFQLSFNKNKQKNY